MENTIEIVTGRIIKDSVEQQEKIIKEALDKGFKYLAIKQMQSYDFKKDKYIIRFHYRGLNSKDDLLKKDGYAIYDLDKTREELRGRKNDNI